MIIGNGLLANALTPYFSAGDDVIIFASGVSNSSETRTQMFEREQRLLEHHLAHDRLLVYFSTCSVDDPELKNSAYVLHKIAMEAIVRTNRRHAIFRLPQVVGKTGNPNTLTNYLHQQVVSGRAFALWLHARRNLIDVDHVATIVHSLITSQTVTQGTCNIAAPTSTSISELVSVFEEVLGFKANCTPIHKGGAYTIDATLACSVARQAGVCFDASYIPRLIRKYYGKA